MELSSKQRAYLRSLSNDLDVIVHIGKDGIGDNLVKQANDALEARELIKCRVLENSMLTAREACDELSALTRSEQVQVIGTKFVLYRPSHKKDKKDKIVLATVKGDIHDIGKNIVKVLLENYSYDVLDLGKDVAPEAIVEETIKNHVDWSVCPPDDDHRAEHGGDDQAAPQGSNRGPKVNWSAARF